MKETWQTIPNFSGYEASTFGRIRSKNYKRTGKAKVMKPALYEGYFKTMLKGDDDRYHTWYVHSWIALTFLGERPDGLEVNHKDGDKLNNSPSNLEYVTRSENVKHAFMMDLLKPMRGERNGMAKLTAAAVRDIRYVAHSGGRYYGRKALAKKYGVAEATIKAVANKRRGAWSHI